MISYGEIKRNSWPLATFVIIQKWQIITRNNKAYIRLNSQLYCSYKLTNHGSLCVWRREEKRRRHYNAEYNHTSEKNTIMLWLLTLATSHNHTSEKNTLRFSSILLFFSFFLTKRSTSFFFFPTSLPAAIRRVCDMTPFFLRDMWHDSWGCIKYVFFPVQ